MIKFTENDFAEVYKVSEHFRKEFKNCIVKIGIEIKK